MFKPRTPPEAIALCSRLLEYTPVTRLSPLEACAHAFFDELRQPNTRLPSGRELPLLFNFSPVGQFTSLSFLCFVFLHYVFLVFDLWWPSLRCSWLVVISLHLKYLWVIEHLFTFSVPSELSIQPQLNSTLIPPHARAQTSPASHGMYHSIKIILFLCCLFHWQTVLRRVLFIHLFMYLLAVFI